MWVFGSHESKYISSARIALSLLANCLVFDFLVLPEGMALSKTVVCWIAIYRYRRCLDNFFMISFSSLSFYVGLGHDLRIANSS